jgi:hypothetical protein
MRLQVSDVETLECNAVFSLVLEEHCDASEQGVWAHHDAGVVIGGVECATLGHGKWDDGTKFSSHA